MDRLWTGLPKNFTHVDAVYENKERQIVFFIGKEQIVQIFKKKKKINKKKPLQVTCTTFLIQMFWNRVIRNL